MDSSLHSDDRESGRGTGWKPPEMLRDLAAGDSELICELVAAFKQDVAARLMRIRSALSTADLAALRAEVHTIKGSARQIGADDVAAKCQQIEAALDAPLADLAEGVRQLEVKFGEVGSAMGLYDSSSEDPCVTR